MQPVGSAGCFSLAKPPAKPTSRNDADVKFKSLGWIEILKNIVAFAEKIQGNAQSPTHRRGNHREDPGQCAFSNSSPGKSQKRPRATRILQLIATEIAEKTENGERWQQPRRGHEKAEAFMPAIRQHPRKRA